MFKNKKCKIIFIMVCVFILIGYSVSVSASEKYEINTYDMNIIQKIYNKNSDILDWDLNDPMSIENTRWTVANNTYYLSSLDLRDTEISGSMDLSDCTYLEYYSFSNTNIDEIALPEDMNQIPEGAFENCSELEYINIPENTSLISDAAFKNCSQLQSVVVHNSSTVLESNSFSGCTSLKCITNANSIISVGRNAFHNCTSLVFYDENIFAEDSYIYSYALASGYDCKSTITASASGYAGIITTNKNQTVDLSKNGLVYKFGTAYLYDDNGTLISQYELDNTGYYCFDGILIGYKYKLVIDGSTAIPRSEYFIVCSTDYDITTNQNAYAIVVCDYNKDGLISCFDVSELYHKTASSSGMTEQEKSVYDFDGDGAISSADAGTVMVLLNTKEYYS